jgi:hypothetical protein
MMMHARALDADLGRKVAEAEARIRRADMCLGQVHQSFGGLTHGLAPLYREIAIDDPNHRGYL